MASQRQAELLILDRTFDRLVDVSAQRFWFVPVGWLMRNRFDSGARISAYPGPVIQIHGSVDSLIPIEHGKNLFSQIAGPSRWIEVPDMGHNDSLPVSILQQMVIEAAKLQDQDMTPTTQKRNNL